MDTVAWATFVLIPVDHCLLNLLSTSMTRSIAGRDTPSLVFRKATIPAHRVLLRIMLRSRSRASASAPPVNALVYSLPSGVNVYKPRLPADCVRPMSLAELRAWLVVVKCRPAGGAKALYVAEIFWFHKARSGRLIEMVTTTGEGRVSPSTCASSSYP